LFTIKPVAIPRRWKNRSHFKHCRKCANKQICIRRTHIIRIKQYLVIFIFSKSFA